MSIDPQALLPLDLARQIEHTVGLCRSLRAHLEHGPFGRTRRRLRKQLGRLASSLDQLQLAALGRPLDAASEALVVETLRALDPRLEHALYHVPEKAGLKELRHDVKRLRRDLEPTVALLAA